MGDDGPGRAQVTDELTVESRPVGLVVVCSVASDTLIVVAGSVL